MKTLFNMAHLHRKPNDFVDLKTVFTKMGIEM